MLLTPISWALATSALVVALSIAVSAAVCACVTSCFNAAFSSSVRFDESMASFFASAALATASFAAVLTVDSFGT